MAKKTTPITERDTTDDLRGKASDAMREFTSHIEGWSDDDLRAVANRRGCSQSVEGDKACRALFVMELFRRSAQLPTLARAFDESSI